MPGDDGPVAGATHLHRFEIHKRVADRLRRTAGVLAVESTPSPMRPVEVRATIELRSFLDSTDTDSEATLVVEWRPRPDRDVFRIQYHESGAPWSCGWHQDGTHEDLGANHFQIDHEGWETPYREPGPFSDPNSMAVPETCLDELRTRLAQLPDEVD